ncbi:hypothetical protein, partial [Melghiribacillus thermohalophilus]
MDIKIDRPKVRIKVRILLNNDFQSLTLEKPISPNINVITFKISTKELMDVNLLNFLKQQVLRNKMCLILPLSYDCFQMLGWLLTFHANTH